MKTTLRLFALSLALPPFVSPLSAQTIAEGYTSTLTQLPSGAGQTLVTEKGIVYFTGKDLVIREGTKTRTLLSFASSVFGSFTIAIGTDTLLFGESKNGSVWRVPLGSGTARQLNTLKFNYSAAVYDSNWAIVSAKLGGLSAKNNDVVAINLNTGVLDPIAEIPGASGPVVVDPFGNLYYATASASFPAPKGKTDILRFSAARVAGAFGSSKLTAADAAVVFKGLDAAGSMALDDDHDLFITDWMNSAIVEISDVQTAQPKRSELASYARANVSASGLQFVPGNRRGLGLQEFEAFQPTGGGALWIHESAFAGVSQVRLVTPRRATTSIDTPNPVAKGRLFHVKIENGPAAGQAWIALGLGPSLREAALRSSFEQTVFWSDNLIDPVVLTKVNLDAQGAARLQLFNPGFRSPLVVTTQTLFQDRAGRVAGSTQPLGITLQ